LLEGYETVRSLSEAERDALQTSAVLAALACATWRLWRYHLRWPNPERATLHRQMWRLGEAIAGLDAGVFGTD
jgi:homoserine kinase type II